MANTKSNPFTLDQIQSFYTGQPTLAAAANLAKVPRASDPPSANPSSIYCTQLGGTEASGGVNAAGGGWAKAAAGAAGFP